MLRATSKGKAHKNSFRSGEAGQLKIRKLLRDIDEARRYGINLRNNISLSDMYSYLKDARKQKTKFEKEYAKGVFRYDDGEDEQPASDDGLDEVERKVRVKNKRRKSRSKRR